VTDEKMFSVYGRMTAQPGRRDQLIAVLLDGLHASREYGLLTYSINTLFDDPDTIWLTQLWTDKHAHDAGTRSEPVAAASRRIPPLLAQPPEGFYGHAVHVGSQPPTLPH
jgi:quinol monooxygenase YgiN